MDTAQPIDYDRSTPGVTLALIDAQNIHASFPIREYLEAHGCTVLVNKTSNTIPDYHIAIGDHNFVKSIFANTEHDGIKRLAIILNSPSVITPDLFEKFNAKIIASESEYIHSRDIPQIFAFFFTSEDTVLTVRGTRISTAERHMKQPSRNASSTDADEGTRDKEDRQRIAGLIKSIYEEPKRKHFFVTHVHSNIFWVFSIILVLTLPFLIHVVTLFTSITMLGVTVASIKGNGESSGTISSGAALIMLEASSRSLEFAKILVYPLPPAHSALRSQERILSLLKSGTMAANSVIRLKKEGETLTALLLNHEEKEDASIVSVESIRKELSFLQRTLSVFVADSISYGETGGNILFMFILDRVNGDVSRLLRIVTTADRILSLYPYLGGFTEEKNYVLLLQNNSELRPTGGFIGGIAKATVAEGRLMNFTVLDVYDLDGQLRGHVEPPAPIRDVLGEIHWYLRDSNWNPDFRISGNRALWFYEKESGTAADGVVAINTRLLQAALRIIGPVDLIDYQDRITADNFFDKSYAYIHTDFFPGSTQKKDFLGSLVNAVMSKVSTSSKTDVLALLDLLVEGILQHDILVYMKDQNTQDIINQYNWSNRVPAYVPCSQSNNLSCTGNYIYTVDANLGLSKVNQHVQKSINHAFVLTGEGKKNEILELTYTNNAQPNESGGEIFRDYLRIYYPESSSIQNITLDGERLLSKNETGDGIQIPYTESSEAPDGLDATAVVFDVQASSTKTISITFGTVMLPENDDFLMDMFYQRQPGIDVPLTTTVEYPEVWKLVPVNAGLNGVDFVAKPGRFEYNNTRRSDASIQVKMTK